LEINTTIHMVEWEQDWDDLRDVLHYANYAALDIETTPVSWYHPDFKILTVAISAREGEAFVIPVEHPETVANPRHQMHDLRTLIEGWDGTWIMQNGAFDHVALRAGNIFLRRWEDTMVMEYLIDVERKKGLQDLASRYLNVEKWKDIDYKKPEEESLDVLARLNGRDADVTLRLYIPMLNELHKHDMGTLYREVMMPASYALCNMEWEGIPVDLDRLDDVISDTEDELETLLDHIKEVAGRDDFNPNSYKQLGNMLYGTLGLPCHIWTDTGAPGTNAEALGKIKNMHPVVEQVLRFKKLRKLLTASLRPWRELADKDGYLHPRYKPAFVKTGRLSSEIPNIQQVPRGAVRTIFGGIPGHQIVEVDFSQMELRIAAFLAEEPTMMRAFQLDQDLHQITADAFKVDRQTAKSLNFGLLYGAGPRKLKWIAKEQYGVDLTELQAESLRARWFKKYRAIAAYHRRMVTQAKIDKGVTTAFGRWRPLEDINDRDYRAAGHAERQAINTPIQSMASDITLIKLTELEQAHYLEGIRPIATVHDSILFLVPDDKLELIPNIQSIMEDTGIFKDLFGVNLTVPLKTDVKVGTHWS